MLSWYVFTGKICLDKNNRHHRLGLSTGGLGVEDEGCLGGGVIGFNEYSKTNDR
jgi:hypothetical protein